MSGSSSSSDMMGETELEHSTLSNWFDEDGNSIFVNLFEESKDETDTNNENLLAAVDHLSEPETSNTTFTLFDDSSDSEDYVDALSVMCISHPTEPKVEKVIELKCDVAGYRHDMNPTQLPHKHRKGNLPEWTGPTPDDEEFCCICMDEKTNPKTLHKCSHSFCTDCIEESFKNKPVCPVCFAPYGVITGNQPEGYMNDSLSKIHLQGYEDSNTIVVSYGFGSGIQKENHPHPGVRYEGTSRTAYLPNNAEGRKVLRLLKESFKRKLTFTIGRSRTTGCDNVVTWNDIHHKTCTHGGQENFGYPDPTYLQRVQEELAAVGVTEESL